MASALKKVLVWGATGKVGGATVRELAKASPKDALEIYAVTRNAKSAAAQKLEQLPRVTVVEGNMDDCESAFKQVNNLWGVLDVQPPAMGGQASEEREIRHGKAVIDASINAGVKKLVYISVQRGANNETDPTNVPHFATKFEIEKHLKAKAPSANLNWTVVQPVAFMDNYSPDFQGKGFAAMWSNLGSKPLQLVSITDVGVVAAQAFMHEDQYVNEMVPLAGDEITFAQADEIFQKQFGTSAPVTFGFVGSLVGTMVKELGVMFQWFADSGYTVDIPKTKQRFPNIKNFEQWLQTESPFRSS